VPNDQNLTLRKIVEELNISTDGQFWDEESLCKDGFQEHHLQPAEQGGEIHADLLQQIENNKWLNRVITGNKSCVFQWQSMQWKFPAIPHRRNVWMQNER
jgi:hypothetical protein